MVITNLKQNNLRLTRQHKKAEVNELDENSQGENDFNGFLRQLAVNEEGRRFSYTPKSIQMITRDRDLAKTFSYQPGNKKL